MTKQNRGPVARTARWSVVLATGIVALAVSMSHATAYAQSEKSEKREDEKKLSTLATTTGAAVGGWIGQTPGALVGGLIGSALGMIIVGSASRDGVTSGEKQVGIYGCTAVGDGMPREYSWAKPRLCHDYKVK